MDGPCRTHRNPDPCRSRPDYIGPGGALIAGVVCSGRTAAGCTNRHCPVQEGDRLSPCHEALVAVPEDDPGVFSPVPGVVL